MPEYDKINLCNHSVTKIFLSIFCLLGSLKLMVTQGNSFLTIDMEFYTQDVTAAGLGSSGGSVVKNPPANAGHSGDMGSVAGSGSFPRGGNDNPLQCSYLGNPLDRGEWQAYRVTESDATELVVSSTQYGGLNNFEC